MTQLLDFSPCSIPWQLEDTLDGVDGQNNWLGIQPSPRHVNLRNIYIALVLCIYERNHQKTEYNLKVFIFALAAAKKVSVTDSLTTPNRIF